MLEFAESFGLTMFVYVLGLYVGPNFFGSMRHEGISLNLWSMAVILVGTLFSLALCCVLPVSLPDMVGILCGATTNTPALGAAQQALQQLGMPSGGAALGCAVTYPLGVVGVILAMMLLAKPSLFASMNISRFWRSSSPIRIASRKKGILVDSRLTPPRSRSRGLASNAEG